MTTESTASSTPKPRTKNRATKPFVPTPTQPPLPTEHVNHDAVFVNELRARHFVFATGANALRQELVGRQTKLDEDIEALQKAHAEAERDLQRRIDDMEAGRDRALRALGEDGLGDQNAAKSAEQDA